MSVLNPYSKIQVYENEYINHNILNSRLKKLYDNDVLLYNYIEQYSKDLIDSYTERFNELSAFFEDYNYNYFTITGHADDMNLVQSTDGTYIYNLSGFGGINDFNPDEMRYLWLLCSNPEIWAEYDFGIYATISGANAVDLETIFTDRYDWLFGPSTYMRGGTTSVIPLPLHRNQESITIELVKEQGTGFFQIIGASTIPTRI